MLLLNLAVRSLSFVSCQPAVVRDFSAGDVYQSCCNGSPLYELSSSHGPRSQSLHRTRSSPTAVRALSVELPSIPAQSPPVHSGRGRPLQPSSVSILAPNNFVVFSGRDQRSGEYTCTADKAHLHPRSASPEPRPPPPGAPTPILAHPEGRPLASDKSISTSARAPPCTSASSPRTCCPTRLSRPPAASSAAASLARTRPIHAPGLYFRHQPGANKQHTTGI